MSNHALDLLIERSRQIGNTFGPLGACSYAAKLEETNRDLLAALKGVAGDSQAMGGFHEQFRAQIRAAISKAEAK